MPLRADAEGQQRHIVVRMNASAKEPDFAQDPFQHLFAVFAGPRCFCGQQAGQSICSEFAPAAPGFRHAVRVNEQALAGFQIQAFLLLGTAFELGTDNRTRRREQLR